MANVGTASFGRGFQRTRPTRRFIPRFSAENQDYTGSPCEINVMDLGTTGNLPGMTETPMWRTGRLKCNLVWTYVTLPDGSYVRSSYYSCSCDVAT